MEEAKESKVIITKKYHYTLMAVELFFILLHTTLMTLGGYYRIGESARAISLWTEVVVILWCIFSSVIWLSQGVIIFVRFRCMNCARPPYVRVLVIVRLISTMICNKFSSALLIIIYQKEKYYPLAIAMIVVEWTGYTLIIPLDLKLF